MSTMREEFERHLEQMPAWAPEFEQHRAWVTALLQRAWNESFDAGRQQGMEQANALWEMAKTSEAPTDGLEPLVALNDKTRSDVDEAMRKLRELDGKEVELWQWWPVVVMALWKAYQLGAATPQPAAERVALTVWFGSMPESNGKRNWTVLLRRKDASGLRGDISNGFCISRSEYYDQMRYCADRLRFLIGELPKYPNIIDYPGDTKEPPPTGIGTTEQAKERA